MTTLQVQDAAASQTKQKALEDAKKMQAVVVEEYAKAGKDPPPYVLLELIGKGSFGRVYKAKEKQSKDLIAVKIIDIEESDTMNPKLADTYCEFLKEINALKLLSESGAKNINHVLDVLPVGHSVWMVTEYCAGGSVATLMKPTAPGGLQDKWIIPILREVAEAIYWVHKQGIIHRDIKCANVLVTEAGGVQLCDFGVAGIIETKFDKRSTFIGTPHWMAPELFDQSTSYGTEVDIWAFGSMVYEIASGLPPNVMTGFNIRELGKYLKTHTPRLEGDAYSKPLKALVAFCLEDDVARRPSIEEVQKHPYILNTSAAYPTSTLANLVKAYRLWEAQGGNRKSLFAPGGAQAISDYSSTAMAADEWNFSTTNDFDRLVLNSTDAQAVFDVYGSNVDFEYPFPEDLAHGNSSSSPVTPPTPPTAKPKARRRAPPPHLPAVKAPLEKVFDPNTMTNYEDNARIYYGNNVAAPPPQAAAAPAVPAAPPALPASHDLPLRDHSVQATLRESLIDLDASLHASGGDLSQFADMDTIRALGPRMSTLDEPNKPPLSDPADFPKNRRTQDWKFPVMASPLSAKPDMIHYSLSGGSGGGEEDGETSTAGSMMPENRNSVSSLIDLDESLPSTLDLPMRRLSMANYSDAGSMTGSERMANPFELERQAAALYQPAVSIMQSSSSLPREPSIYISDDSQYAYGGSLGLASSHENIGNSSVSGNIIRIGGGGGSGGYAASEYLESDYLRQSRLPGAAAVGSGMSSKAGMTSMGMGMNIGEPRAPRGLMDDEDDDGEGDESTLMIEGNCGAAAVASDMMMANLPPVPAAPSPRVMEGLTTDAEVRDDFMRLLQSLSQHLEVAKAHVVSLPVQKPGRVQGDTEHGGGSGGGSRAE